MDSKDAFLISGRIFGHSGWKFLKRVGNIGWAPHLGPVARCCGGGRAGGGREGGGLGPVSLSCQPEGWLTSPASQPCSGGGGGEAGEGRNWQVARSSRNSDRLFLMYLEAPIPPPATPLSPPSPPPICRLSRRWGREGISSTGQRLLWFFGQWI
jgi:hypothetical protein